MGSFADLNELANRMSGGNDGNPEYYLVSKEWRMNGVSGLLAVQGRWVSSWLLEGQPSHGAVPGAAAACDNTTPGGFMQTAPGGGRQKFLTNFLQYCAQNATFLLYDRLLHAGGFDSTVTTANTVGGTLTRHTTGEYNQIWIEIYQTLGATSTTISASYTNQAGVSGRTTAAAIFGGSGSNIRDFGRSFPLPLQEGDYGVRSVESVTIAASTGTAGSYGVAIVRPLMMSGVNASRATARTFLDGPVPDVSTSCLAMMVMAGIATSPTYLGGWVTMVER